MTPSLHWLWWWTRLSVGVSVVVFCYAVVAATIRVMRDRAQPK